MPTFTPTQLKKALTDAGFTVFRTLPDEVVIAERVRENLIMDSGIRLRGAPTLEVRLVFRVNRSEHPADDEERLFDRARLIASPARAGGFEERGHERTAVHDPGDRTRTLDTYYEVHFGRAADDLDAALDGVRFAFALDRASPHPE